MLQDDLHHDVAGVAAAVDGLFDHLVKFLEDDEFLGVVGAVVELLQQREHHLVGLTLGELQAVVTGVPDARKGERLVVLHLKTDRDPQEVCRGLGTTRRTLPMPLPVIRLVTGVSEAIRLPFPVATDQLRQLALDNIGPLDGYERAFGVPPRAMDGQLGYLRRKLRDQEPTVR